MQININSVDRKLMLIHRKDYRTNYDNRQSIRNGLTTQGSKCQSRYSFSLAVEVGSRCTLGTLVISSLSLSLPRGFWQATQRPLSGACSLPCLRIGATILLISNCQEFILLPFFPLPFHLPPLFISYSMPDWTLDEVQLANFLSNWLVIGPCATFVLSCVPCTALQRFTPACAPLPQIMPCAAVLMFQKWVYLFDSVFLAQLSYQLLIFLC